MLVIEALVNSLTTVSLIGAVGAAGLSVFVTRSFKGNVMGHIRSNSDYTYERRTGYDRRERVQELQSKINHIISVDPVHKK